MASAGIEAKADKPPGGLKALIAEPKGKLDYTAGEPCMLHVFWQARSAAAADELLAGLRQCATATHRDTPCTPTYFFRVHNADAELCPPPPRTVGDMPQIIEAHRKVGMGIPAPAVRAGLAKAGVDPGLLDVGPSTPVPLSFQCLPVAVEFTELYVDERAFMEHAGSRDYLDGYGVVMKPSLLYRPPRTFRFGTPCANMVDKILEPILKETPLPILPGSTVWQAPRSVSNAATFISLDVQTGDAEALGAALPTAFTSACTTCVVFAHPMRQGTSRIMAVVAHPTTQMFAGLSGLNLARGEAHVTSGDKDAIEAVTQALHAAGLGMVSVNASPFAGYALHAKAAEVRVRP